MTGKTIAMVGLLALLASGRGVAEDTNALAGRLRALVRLPQVAFDLEPRFGRTWGITADEDVGDPAAALARATPGKPGTFEDATERLRLYRWALRAGDTNAVAHRDAALAGFRAATNTPGREVSARIGLARTWSLAGDPASAIPVLREVVGAHADNWEAWGLLGDALGQRSLTVFTDWGDAAPANAMGAYVLGRLKPRGDAAAARALFDEAGRCLETAVKLAPDEPVQWATRLPFFLDREMRRRVLSDPSTPSERQAAVSLVHQATAAPEVEEALKHLPDDHRLQGLAIYLHILPELAAARVRLGMGEDGRRAVDSLRSETRGWVRERLERLKALAERPGVEPRRQAGAAEMAGAYEYLLFANGAEATRLARRSLTLDPSRRQAFELVVAGVVSAGRWSELEAFCKERLGVQDGPLPRLLLAKARFNAGRREASLTALTEAVERFPQDRLLLAAWLAARLSVPGQPEDPRMSARLAQMFPDPLRIPDDTDASRSVMLSAIIGQCLEGQTDVPKRLLRGLLVTDPDNDYARSILLELR